MTRPGHPCLIGSVGKRKKPSDRRTSGKSQPATTPDDSAPSEDRQVWLRRDQLPLQLAVDLVLGLPVSAEVETELLAYHQARDTLGRQSARPASLWFKGSSSESERLFDHARMMLDPEVRAWVKHDRGPGACLANVTLDDLEPVLIWVKPAPFVRWAIGHGVPVPDDLRRLAAEGAGAQGGDAQPDVAQGEPFCMRLTAQEQKSISRPQYEDEVQRRAANHLFLDAVMPLARGMYRAGRIDAEGFFHDLSVSSTEAEIVVRLAKAGGRIPGAELANTQHPDKLVEKVRKKIDVRTEGRYRSIRTHGHGEAKTYELAPDVGIRWCVLAPLDGPADAVAEPTT